MDFYINFMQYYLSRKYAVYLCKFNIYIQKRKSAIKLNLKKKAK